MVTNITERPVALAKAELKGIKGGQDCALISVKDISSPYSGPYDIPPRARTTVSICFILYPKKLPRREEALKLKVGIFDQFGNICWVKNVIFRAT